MFVTDCLCPCPEGWAAASFLVCGFVSCRRNIGRLLFFLVLERCPMWYPEDMNGIGSRTASRQDSLKSVPRLFVGKVHPPNPAVRSNHLQLCRFSPRLVAVFSRREGKKGRRTSQWDVFVEDCVTTRSDSESPLWLWLYHVHAFAQGSCSLSR